MTAISAGHCDCRICNIKYWPMWNLNPIDDMAYKKAWFAKDAIGEISKNSAQQ
jgi:hypothetical protein